MRHRRNTELFEKGRHHAVALGSECPKEMQRLNLLLSRTAAHFLRGLQGLLSLHRKFVKS